MERDLHLAAAVQGEDGVAGVRGVGLARVWDIVAMLPYVRQPALRRGHGQSLRPRRRPTTSLVGHRADQPGVDALGRVVALDPPAVRRRPAAAASPA